jgi:malate dehydrogenase (oxaloacetate-decarboxylating)
MSDVSARSLKLHEEKKGKIEITPKIPLETRDDLSLAYTPGVAAVSAAIAKDKTLTRRYTIKHNTVAVISDGSAVLGLGNIGPEAAIPVMEGKCLLLKHLANIDAFPLCIDVHSSDDIVKTVKAIAPVFAAINLEDIAAPICFEVEERLKNELDIPVMHDDQHATAVVVLAALTNALIVVNKGKNARIVINGAGAAGIATARMLVAAAFADIVIADTSGAIYSGRKENMNAVKEVVAEQTNKKIRTGTLAELLVGADVFIGVSVANALSREMVQSMAKNAVIFAMANPIPEIMPDDAKAAGAAIIATGRSDLPNQVNNVLAFPGIFRGALDAHALAITEEMKLAAATALASLVSSPAADSLLPNPLDQRVVPTIAAAVQSAAKTGQNFSR